MRNEHPFCLVTLPLVISRTWLQWLPWSPKIFLLCITTHYYTYHKPWTCCTCQSHRSPIAALSSSTRHFLGAGLVQWPLKLNKMQCVTYYYSLLKWCSLNFYDLSYNRGWLQETVYAIYIPFIYFGSQHIQFLHPAWAAGYARGWCSLSTDTRWRNTSKIYQLEQNIVFLRYSSHVVAKVAGSTSVGRCSIPSNDKGLVLKRLMETADLLIFITTKLLHHLLLH